MPRFVTAILVTAVVVSAAFAAEQSSMLVTADNPDPETLPTLSVYQHDIELRVRAAFPNVPDFAFDSWCYESQVDCVGIRAIDGGRIELRHRDRNHPQTIYVTTITPMPGAVEFRAVPELATDSKGRLPRDLQTLNMCWQLKPAPNFASAPDPYPDFVKRCFIYTENGRTFLDKTERNPIPVRPTTDKENNPPWVQMYVGTWDRVPKASATSWAAYSSDQYVTTIIGTVSRDGKYLAAQVSDSANTMSQAWHDCTHNSATWSPAGAPPEDRVWRIVTYAMENDADALLARAAQDFPGLRGASPTAK